MLLSFSFAINVRSACVLKSIFKLPFSLRFSSMHSFWLKTCRTCQDAFTYFCTYKATSIIKFSFITSAKSCKVTMKHSFYTLVKFYKSNSDKASENPAKYSCCAHTSQDFTHLFLFSFSAYAQHLKCEKKNEFVFRFSGEKRHWQKHSCIWAVWASIIV